ncbi:MAG: ABC transporter permease [Pseudohongiella sp.]|nr:ABC transporter permease [Pseudohongiella sp.]
MNKLYGTISIVGLSIGFCAVFLMALYINDELSYDSWLPSSQEIYRTTVSTDGGGIRYGAVPSDTGLWLAQDYPQIDLVSRLFPSRATVGFDDIEFSEIVYWSDANVFDMFQFKVLQGDLTTSLQQPNSIVINQTTAEKYFPHTDPLGKYLLLSREHSMRVTAVIEDIPSNTHFRPNILAPGHALFSPAARQDRNPISGSFGRKLWATRTYVRIDNEATLAAVTDDMPAMLNRHLPPEGGRVMGDIYRFKFQPITEIHTSSDDPDEDAADLSSVYTVGAIAFLIILAATINFINLMTARGLKRAPEIAIRKTIGASRTNLITQYMLESFLYVFLGASIAIVLSYLLLPPLNSFLSRTIEYGIFTNSRLLLGTGLTVLLAGLLAGSYPSFILSAYSPRQVFSVARVEGGAGLVRKVLSTIQFAILTLLLMASFVIYQQAQFGTNEALRQNTDPILILNTSCSSSLKQSLQQMAGVQLVSCAEQIPQLGLGSTTGLFIKGNSDRRAGVSYMSADPNYLSMYGINILAGRSFSATRVSDESPVDNVWNRSESIIINESTAKQLGFDSPIDAIGQVASWNHLFALPSTFTELHDAEIIGVFEDFQIGSIRSEIPNAAFFFHPAQMKEMSIKLTGQDIPETLESIDQLWREFGDPKPIQRRFFDERIENMYRSVTQQAQLLGLYTVAAVFIAILGLVGLAAFLAERRTKEVGIRKVLGGSRMDIVLLLLFQFSKPVILSNFLAWPLAYYYLNQWLSGFSRHIELQWWMFLGAGTATLSFALATVFVHAYITAGINPVRALRYE